MEDFILKEIDKLGEMLRMIARKLGLLDGTAPDYTLDDVKDEIGKSDLPSDLDESVKSALLADALAYLDGKGYYSFRLHALI